MLFPHRLFPGEDAGGEWDGEKVAASFLGACEAAQGVGGAGLMHQSWAGLGSVYRGGGSRKSNMRSGL